MAKRKTVASESKAKKAKAVVTPDDAAEEIVAPQDLKTIRAKEQAILESRKHTNKILQLLELAEGHDEPQGIAVLLGTTQSLRRVFVQLAQRGDLVLSQQPAPENAASALKKYRTWLGQLFERYLKLLLRLLHNEDVRLQVAAIHSLMEFVRLQCEVSSDEYDLGLFPKVVLGVVLSPHLTSITMEELHKHFTSKPDVGFFFTLHTRRLFAAKHSARLEQWSACSGMDEGTESITTDTIARNGLELLLMLGREDFEDGDEGDEGDDELKPFAAIPEGSKIQKRCSDRKRLKEDSECWFALLKLNFPNDVYKSILINMHENILHRIATPLLLADFLTDSYDIGGVISILALNGLFILITEHGLDYPKFFNKLYSLCKPSILRAKYRPRFFKLLAMFLTSGQLPAYLVAAFCKRLARLALTAPPGACLFLVTCVYNLLRRHPTCRQLIHAKVAPVLASSLADKRDVQIAIENAAKEAVETAPTEEGGEDEGEAGEEEEVKEKEEGLLGALDLGVAVSGVVLGPAGEDPFVEHEEDPALCNALQSSLWEIKSLNNHYCPAVARMAQIFEAENAPRNAFPIEEYAMTNYQTLFEEELNFRKNQKIPLAFEKQAGLFATDGILSRTFVLAS